MLSNGNTAEETQTRTKSQRALVVSIILGLVVVTLLARNTATRSEPSVLTKQLLQGDKPRIEKDAIGMLKDSLKSRARKDCLKRKAMHARRLLSWQAYVDTQLVATGQIDQAGIFSKADGSAWGTTPSFGLKTYKIVTINPNTGVPNGHKTFNEAASLVSAAKSGHFGPDGCRVNGVKYMIVNSNPNGPVFYGKKPQGGICIAVTNQAIIVGTYSQQKGQSPGGTNAAVENLATYLRDSGYMGLDADADC